MHQIEYCREVNRRGHVPHPHIDVEVVWFGEDSSNPDDWAHLPWCPYSESYVTTTSLD